MTNENIFDIIAPVSKTAMERWLSWSKARDWKSRKGDEPFSSSNLDLSAKKSDAKASDFLLFHSSLFTLHFSLFT